RLPRRTSKLGDSISEKLTKGDTAVCVFNTFDPGDLDAFKGYLSGEEDEMPPGDPMTIFLEALSRAKADPEVKNFVVDISGNMGGSVDLVHALTAILSGENETEIVCQNTLDGQFYTEFYEIDTNMDGKFDEADKEVTCDLRIAVLTSRISFSCGNLFPAMMKDKGVLIMGEQSGGGACAIQCMATADGICYQISSHRMHMLDGSGGQVDFGVPVDVDLIGKNPDGSDRMVSVQIDGILSTDDGRISSDEIEVKIPDYSEFYDLERLSGEINAFYDGK
ncbi:MAG: S41 family peptidase, partial [Eubacteriales bacterium]|nr:S41 family peptidase [Eubacteriales bacterium]